ncbi:MAG: deoxynucleoside kinase [Oscillospiraceae bacterium]|jgi:dTMP kinase|nr:deoxynucleoside kinase [Oscillospiraceae bacterium]
MAKLIVIDGLDGSGKATQAKRLQEALLKKKQKNRLISFPEYEDKSSVLVRMYLNGEFGSNVDLINPHAASIFYAVDRFSSYNLKWKSDYLAPGYIIADRYTTSNIIHQTTKIQKDQWEDFWRWLYDIEYGKLELPRPEIVIYLNMSPSICLQLLSKRYNGNPTADLHERNIDYLNRCQEIALYAAKKLGWHVIDCHEGKHPLSEETIEAAISNLLDCV